ncbi:HAD-IC family P-type ATPase, partial [bacterium]|nr:HAD-IC family P-type ATPase [bacterium]
MKNSAQWHTYNVITIVEDLKSDIRTGLRKAEADNRREEYGLNMLVLVEKTPWYKVLLRQFTDVLILILFAAAAVSLAIGAFGDAATILGIIVLNGLLGFVQELKAENAIELLKQMLYPTCRVLRDAKEQIIDAKLLVPGDIVLLEIGDTVPADLRLLESFNLKADESSLTGESKPVSKRTATVMQNAPLSEQFNMGWM